MDTIWPPSINAQGVMDRLHLFEIIANGRVLGHMHFNRVIAKGAILERDLGYCTFHTDNR